MGLTPFYLTVPDKDHHLFSDHRSFVSCYALILNEKKSFCGSKDPRGQWNCIGQSMHWKRKSHRGTSVLVTCANKSLHSTTHFITVKARLLHSEG
eukprot:Seg1680.9 transcript_id=Seg1680.9/GoldUCD/mRNA.D3Y31 product="hypothetical protein" protein_id=Seg1680.9/GoldUCD/D3Y31